MLTQGIVHCFFDRLLLRGALCCPPNFNCAGLLVDWSELRPQGKENLLPWWSHLIQVHRNLIPGGNLAMEYYPIHRKVEILLITKCRRNRNKLLQESTLILCINFFNLPYSEKRGHLNYDGLLIPYKKRNVICRAEKPLHTFPIDC